MCVVIQLCSVNALTGVNQCGGKDLYFVFLHTTNRSTADIKSMLPQYFHALVEAWLSLTQILSPLASAVSLTHKHTLINAETHLLQPND